MREFDGKPVCTWIVARLVYARRHGWRGVVVSGYRTDAEQIAAATRYAHSLGKTVAQVYPNGPLASNHCGKAYPRGAVDVTHPEELATAMKLWKDDHKGRPLAWGLPVINDAPHFSLTGH